MKTTTFVFIVSSRRVQVRSAGYQPSVWPDKTLMLESAIMSGLDAMTGGLIA
jgi:hypothetical protein